MNDKINKLWDKAVNLIQDNNDGDWSLDACKEKFAELIVQECIEVVERQKAKMSYGPTFVIEDIKKHFGVEE
jgi:hypothetical protein